MLVLLFLFGGFLKFFSINCYLKVMILCVSLVLIIMNILKRVAVLREISHNKRTMRKQTIEMVRKLADFIEVEISSREVLFMSKILCGVTL